jgi:hypothetical protein
VKKKKPVACPECKGAGTSYLDEKGSSDHMNAHSCGSCFGTGIRKEDSDRNARLNNLLAQVIGYNELAKLAKVLGEKVYYRLFRDHAEEQYIKMGGQKLFSREDGVCEINHPGPMPHIIFSAADIEMMRKAVAEHDTKAVPNEHPHLHCDNSCLDDAAHYMLEQGAREFDCPSCKATKDEACRIANFQTCLKRRVLAANKELAEEPLPEGFVYCDYCKTPYCTGQWAESHTDESCFSYLQEQIESGELHR